MFPKWATPCPPTEKSPLWPWLERLMSALKAQISRDGFPGKFQAQNVLKERCLISDTGSWSTAEDGNIICKIMDGRKLTNQIEVSTLIGELTFKGIYTNGQEKM